MTDTRQSFDPKENIAETVAREARKPMPLGQDDETGATLFAVPEGWSLQTDQCMEKLALTPYRKRGKATFVDTASFVTYVNTHKKPESKLYATVDQASESPLAITAIFNDHQASDVNESKAGWLDFNARLLPKASHEWKKWTAHDGKAMSQFDFAQFIEDNMKDIATKEGLPNGTEMLRMALQFELTQDKRIKTAIRIQSGGTNIEYVEDDDTGTVERMSAFDRFALGIPVFWRGQPYYIEAKLRYRLREGVLKIWYDLIRPDVIVDDAVEGILETVSNEVGLPVLYGHVNQ